METSLPIENPARATVRDSASAIDALLCVGQALCKKAKVSNGSCKSAMSAIKPIAASVPCACASYLERKFWTSEFSPPALRGAVGP